MHQNGGHACNDRTIVNTNADILSCRFLCPNALRLLLRGICNPRYSCYSCYPGHRSVTTLGRVCHNVGCAMAWAVACLYVHGNTPFSPYHYNTRVRAGLLTRSHWVRGFAAPLAYLELAYYIGIKSVFMFFLQKSCWK